MSQWRVTIDQDVCVGSGTCTAVAPGFFALDDEDRSCPVSDAVPALPMLLEAAALCPTRAIQVVDTETGERRD